MSTDTRRVGLVLGSHLAPARIPETARRAEEHGFSELWLAEDYWLTGAISAATAALAATRSVPVGLGIVPAMTRHPSLLAMEISTIAHMFPGRFWPGIGLGLPAWLRQMGVHPASHLGAMRQTITSVRRLLAGETVTEDGPPFRFENIRLSYPLEEPVPIYAGVISPKMLGIAGEVADGTVVSVLAGTDYLHWARERVASGQEVGNRRDHHDFAVFTMFSADDDAQAARDALRPLVAWYMAAVPKNTLWDVYGIADELAEMAEGGIERISQEMPDRWLDDLAVVGTPEDCAASIARLHDAGADSVCLYLAPTERADALLELAAERVLPLLR
jgi:alkanesulfonate monooxygenase SsuD/methylene tetrahydromethanopterin reductase-like flavin-dependent oxidoreductase (luciferase family)